MSADPPFFPDEPLLRDLEAFAMTLERRTGEPIHPESAQEPEILTGSQPKNSDLSHWGWLATAAAVLLIVGLGALALVALTDSTGPTPAGRSDAAASTDGTGQEPDSAQSRVGATESLDSEPSDRDPFAPVGPATLLTVDGAPLATVDLDAQSGEPSIFMDPAAQSEQRTYAELAIGQLLSDPDRLTAAGWSPDLTDEQGQPLSAERWLAQSGVVLRTYLDSELWTGAREAILESLANGSEVDPGAAEDFDHDIEVITIDPASGALSVFLSWPEPYLYWVSERSETNPDARIVGSSPLDPSAFPCCIAAAGSAFKPITLAALFEAGHSVDDLVRADGPCTFEEPYSVDGRYTVGGRPAGHQSIAAVTARSNNCAFVRLGQSIGTENVLDMARRLGITNLRDETSSYLSLPLGIEVVDPIELTAVYGTFAADGIRNAPETTAEIISPSGTVLWTHEPTNDRALSPQTARSVNQVLESAVASGTGRRAQIDGHHIAGKTGTTNDAANAWFIGYSTDYVTTVWIGTAILEDAVGPPIRIPGYSAFGGGLPATIWHNYMAPVHSDLEAVQFTPPNTPQREPVLLEADTEIES